MPQHRPQPTARDASFPHADKLAAVEQQLNRLAHSELSPPDFFKRFLDLAVKVIPAAESTVWGLDRDGRVQPVCSVSAKDDTRLLQAAIHRRRLQWVLDVLHRGQSVAQTIEPTASAPAIDPALVLLAPLIRGQQSVGVVELLVTGSIDPDNIKRQLALLNRLVCHASGYMQLRSEQNNRAGDTKTPPNDDWSEFLLRLHRDTSLQHVSHTAVNESRRLIGYDRVSLAMRRGNRTVIAAVSGQSSVHHRSNLIRSMSKLAGHVLATGESLHYAGDIEPLPPPVKESLLNHVTESGATSLDIVPLSEPQQVDHEDKSDHQSPPHIIGGLLLERFSSDNPVAPIQQVQKLTEHIAQALGHARQLDRVVLLPTRRKLGEMMERRLSRHRSKVVFAMIGVAVLIAAMTLVRVPYRVEARGKLVPTSQLRVFAPHDGQVEKVFVHSGQQVRAGQPLLQLRNDELATQLLLARNQLDGKRKLLAALQAERDQVGHAVTRADAIKLEGRISQTQTEMAGLLDQIEMLERERSSLQICSEIDGSVVTFQPEDLLAGRPVERGHLLLEVMQEHGHWQLELHMPASRLGHVTSARSVASDDPLPVQFVLATMPGRSFTGRLAEIAVRTSKTTDGANIIPLRVALDATELPHRTVGVEVIARIDCGRRSLLYVLFGDAWEFFRRRWW